MHPAPSTDSAPSDALADDSVLFAAVVAGDRTAFRELHARHTRAVYINCLAIVRSRADTEEVTQEVWLELWRRRSQLVLAGGSILPWLLVTSRFRSLDWIRRGRVTAAQLSIDEWERTAGSSATDDPIRLSDLAALIEETVSALPEASQRIYQLCLVDGLSYADAATSLGLSHATVRNRLSRVRATLRAAIGSPTPDATGTGHRS